MQQSQSSPEALSSRLLEAGYNGLFLSGSNRLVDLLWLDGKNKNDLIQIVNGEEYPDYARFLSSEILFEKEHDYISKSDKGILGNIYTQALENSSIGSSKLWISGNEWGFMYYADKHGINDYGKVGFHLLKIGKPAVPYLVKLLDNNNAIFYEGSQEATLGNNLRYRVKDAAAYYIGKIIGIAVEFNENTTGRDAAIEKLKQQLKS